MHTSCLGLLTTQGTGADPILGGSSQADTKYETDRGGTEMKQSSTLFARVITLAVLVLALIGFAFRFWQDSRKLSDHAKGHGLPGIGEVISVPPFERWDDQKETLIMVMQVGCHWCVLSAPFYRDLIQSNSHQKFHPVAALPQSIPQSRVFLNGLGLEIGDIRQVDFAALGVEGTPTLILVDERGRLKATWEGYLSKDRQKEVFEKLRISEAVSQ
jgi:hypothetical protein